MAVVVFCHFFDIMVDGCRISSDNNTVIFV